VPTRVFVDSDVLFKAPIRNILFELAFRHLVELRWSREVEREVIRNLDIANPNWAVTFKRTASYVHAAFPGTMEESGLSGEPISGVHEKDWHVAEAALNSASAILVTDNVRHFNREAVQRLGLQVSTADELFMSLVKDSESEFLIAVAMQIVDYSNPPMPLQVFTNAVRKCNCPQTAEFIESSSNRIIRVIFDTFHQEGQDSGEFDAAL
jgi:hypothetical protein